MFFVAVHTKLALYTPNWLACELQGFSCLCLPFCYRNTRVIGMYYLA